MSLKYMTAEVAVVCCSGDLRGDQGSVFLVDSLIHAASYLITLLKSGRSVDGANR